MNIVVIVGLADMTNMIGDHRSGRSSHIGIPTGMVFWLLRPYVDAIDDVDAAPRTIGEPHHAIRAAPRTIGRPHYAIRAASRTIGRPHYSICAASRTIGGRDDRDARRTCEDAGRQKRRAWHSGGLASRHTV